MDYRRVITAAAKMGVLWGIGWVVAAVTFRAINWFVFLHRFAPLSHLTLVDFLASGLLRSFVVGWLAGAGFAVLLTFAERNRTILTLSPTRVALWAALMSGGIGVLSFALAFLAHPALSNVAGFLAVNVVVLAAFGAIAGASTLAIARRGEEPAQLSESAPVGELR